MGRWPNISADEVDRLASREDGAMGDDEMRRAFKEEDRKTRADPAFQRLMALPDHVVLTDAEFYLKAGVAEEQQWQRNIVSDPREVVLRRIARQILDRLVTEAFAEGITVTEALRRYTVDPAVEVQLQQELSVYTDVTFQYPWGAEDEKVSEEVPNYLYRIGDE